MMQIVLGLIICKYEHKVVFLSSNFFLVLKSLLCKCHFSCFKCNYISKLVSYNFLLRITKGGGGGDSSADVGKKEKKANKYFAIWPIVKLKVAIIIKGQKQNFTKNCLVIKIKGFFLIFFLLKILFYCINKGPEIYTVNLSHFVVKKIDLEILTQIR